MLSSDIQFLGCILFRCAMNLLKSFSQAKVLQFMGTKSFTGGTYQTTVNSDPRVPGRAGNNLQWMSITKSKK